MPKKNEDLQPESDHQDLITRKFLDFDFRILTFSVT